MVLIGGVEERAATTMFVETLDNFQHWTRLISENRSSSLNCSLENNPKTRTLLNSLLHFK
jgi:hypothetical protein